MSIKLLENLEKLRQAFNQPLIINSGFRCSTHNEQVGGRPNSEHLIGNAVDISLSNIPTEKLHNLIFMSYAFFNGVGMAKTFIHLDVRKEPTHWIY